METPTSKKKNHVRLLNFRDARRAVSLRTFGRNSESQRSSLSIGGCEESSDSPGYRILISLAFERLPQTRFLHGRGSAFIKAGDLPYVANPCPAPRKQNKQIGHSGSVDKEVRGGGCGAERGCRRRMG